jgi:NAD(P)-dependent dehydrogenase (short-subunit alcohol dehydrogenase family)
MKLANKVALITGAGSGMGKSAALLFASEGAKVASVDINAAQVSETVAAITTQGGQALALRADVAQSAAVQRMVEDPLAQLGPPTLLYQNAGIEGEAPSLAHLPAEG